MKTEAEKALGRVFRSWEEPAPPAPFPGGMVESFNAEVSGTGNASRESFPWGAAAAALLVLGLGSWGLTQQKGLPLQMVENSRLVGQEVFGPKAGETLLQGVRDYWIAPRGKGEKS